MLKRLKNIAIFCATILTVNGYSQCTKVCGTVTAVASGTTSGSSTVTPAPGTTFTVQQKAGTSLTVTPVGSYSVVTTYSYVSTTGTNTITSGALSVSVSNVGDVVAQFNGTTLPAGSTVNISIPNAILPQYTYNCLASALVILVNR